MKTNALKRCTEGIVRMHFNAVNRQAAVCLAWVSDREMDETSPRQSAALTSLPRIFDREMDENLCSAGSRADLLTGIIIQ
ncbi:MAG: hypothetical protein J6B02_01810 [Selenomonadales bacterium]|nr:hypothetical protein [Selenomonadales bacterium]